MNYLTGKAYRHVNLKRFGSSRPQRRGLLMTLVMAVIVRQLGVLNLRIGGRAALALSAGPKDRRASTALHLQDIDGLALQAEPSF